MVKPSSGVVWTAACAGVVAAMAAAMRLEGRVWISTSGTVKLWHGDVWSSECSQQVLDPYSITHVSHGLFFALVLGWIGRVLARRGFAWGASCGWQVLVAAVIAAGWEVLENSEFIINRYRTVTMSLDYLGDSILNATGDVLCCLAGFFIARRLGLWRTLAFFAATELLLLWMIRDNLTLNVIMLIHPVDAIKAWQSADAPVH